LNRPDHIGGIKQVKEVNPNFNIPVFKKKVGNDLDGYGEIKDGQVFIAPGVHLRAVHTPGHTKDHVSFYLEEENAIFTGDCILGYSTAVFENLSEMLSSLSKLLLLQPCRLYPGHGAVVENGIQKIEEYIAHRNDREKEILKWLEKEPLTSIGLVCKMYPDLPKNVIPAAHQVVCLHLEKLVEEKRIFQSNEEFKLL
jgi:endoribonuclease LACTB2